MHYKLLQGVKEKGGKSLLSLSGFYKVAQIVGIQLCIAKWKNLEMSQLDIPMQSL